MKIAIIDIIGIPYDGVTLENQGLGGSESAIILISKELSDLGFEVTVFNNCDIDHASPGIYNNVTYLPLTELANDHYFDVVISSRTVIPFTDPKDYPILNDNRSIPFQSMNLYDRILSKAKMRILWMHDTFCLGDSLIEDLTVNNRITDIFTLSDWHLTYIANCNHGRMRNFEVLKRKLFITRNGARNYNKEVNIAAKDRNLFVYNASATKGMVPLVEKIWPKVKQHIPEAKLKVIGGYYRFSKSSAPDDQEKKWREMANDKRNTDLGIEFTGVIPQRDIADILTKANFMIYPAAFPETFGISALESLLYNTPLLTCRFGALEEIAIEGACYHIDYAIEPNGLFPNINSADQIEKFVRMTVEAYHNTYLHQQKQYYCNIVKEIAGWDSVALQWKQHIFRTTGDYLSLEDYRAVTKINHKVHKVWRRRYHNVVELEAYKLGKEKEIVVISPFYNCEKYIARCIESIAIQDYDNYKVILIDDCSTDNTVTNASDMLNSLPNEIREKFTLIVNTKNQGAVRNQIENIRMIQNPEAVIMLIDGDDSLVNDNSIFSYFNGVYDDAEFTYGSCWSMVDNIPLISQPYPESIKAERSYRSHHFNWIMPYTHLRTFKRFLLDDIDDSLFQDEEGKWFGAGGDGSVFYALIEQANPNKIKCLQQVVYNYNDINPINDYKINGEEQTRNARKIIQKMNNISKKKILIAIPTANNIEATTFKAIYDLVVPDNYDVEFQYFFGYQVDQVRNLIADWVVKGYDYLFSVDSDISFPPDTLAKLLAHDKDVVCGLYIQRIPGTHTLEVYESTPQGGMSNIPVEKLPQNKLIEIAGCGFGCTLVKKKVMVDIGYPQFKYYSAIDHKDTVSEDVDFCAKALAKGFKIWADTSIICNHTGKFSFNVDKTRMKGLGTVKAPILAAPIPKANAQTLITSDTDIQNQLRSSFNSKSFNPSYRNYLIFMKDQLKLDNPKMIYDIGACVLNWSNMAKEVWPNAQCIAFEAADVVEFLYKENNVLYDMNVLSDQDGKPVNFYQNNNHLHGSSYYRENTRNFYPGSAEIYSDDTARQLKTMTLDTIVEKRSLPLPDLIKIDVQGAELDVIKGASKIIRSVKHIILNLQEVEFNQGAPNSKQVIAYMNSIGFDCVFEKFSSNDFDANYHFLNRELYFNK